MPTHVAGARASDVPDRSASDIDDAYGRGRDIEVHASAEVLVDASSSGGWYDVTITTPGENSFSVTLAGRLESRAPLTSDPQLGRS